MRRKALMLALAVVLLATAGIVLLLTYLQVRVRLYPDSPPLKPQPVDSPFERVFFSTEDGLTISAWYAAPRSGAGQAVMLMHGLQGNRDQLLPHAAYLRESGYGVLLIDFRNHGESEGSVTSMGYHEIKDARAAYTYLQARPEVTAIAIWGHSMGGAVACKLMSEVKAAGLIVDATFADFSALVRAGAVSRGYPAALAELLFNRLYGMLSRSNPRAIRPLDDLAKVDKGVLLLHGSDDPAIPLAQAEQLAEANPHVRLSIFEGGGHSDLFELDPVRYRAEVLAYLRQAFAAKTDT